MTSLLTNSNCCTCRQPPSPDAVPPRPILSQRLNIPKVARDPVVSWTAVEAAEMRAILEEDDKDVGAEIIQVKQNSTHKLKAILLGKENGSETGSELLNLARSPTSTLTAVTQKLRKHLSRDSALNKRHSRTSVGTSSEEVERRAELRRIREKRIKEELSSEGLYDDDAKSLASVDANSPRENQNQTSMTPGGLLLDPPYPDPQYLEYPSLTYPVLQPLKKSQTSEDQAWWKQTPRQVSLQIDSSVTLVNSSGGTISRRHSSPILNDWEPTLSNPAAEYVSSRKQSSLPSIPPEPVIAATHLPDITDATDATKSSWRLSFSSNKRGELLRELNQHHTEPLPVTLEHFGVSPLPMRAWMHSQGLRSPSQAIVSSEDDSKIGVPASHADTCNLAHDFGGVDGGIEANAVALHLHEMGISQRLASSRLQSSASSPQLSTWGSHNRGVSSSNESRKFGTERARYLNNTSDSAPLSERIPQSWGKVLPDGTSSFYPSAGNSIQPTPQSSRYHLSSLVAASNKADPVELRKPPVAYSANEKTATPSITDSFMDFAPPLTRQSRRTTIDDSSVLASETSSFRHREAELSIIPKRFASAEQHVPSTPRSSRFREEFDLEISPPPSPPSRKPSRFSKLKKRLTLRSFDGPKDMEDILSTPMPNFDPMTLKHSGTINHGGLMSPGGPMSPNSDDNTTSLWGMAVKTQGQRKASQIGHNLHLPPKKNSQDGRNNSAIEDEIQSKSVFGQFTRNLGGGKKKKVDLKDHVSAAQEYQEKFQKRLVAKEMVLDDWEAEMAATAKKAQAKSRNIVKKAKPTGPDRRYPATWARYPSHSREERSTSAGRRDNVDSADFAIAKRNEKGEAVWYHSEKKHHLYHHDNDDHPSHVETHRHFKQRVGDRKERAEQKIKHKKYKLDRLTEQGASGHAMGRRSSLTTAGRLEFPELEILPITIRTKEQQAQDIHEELHEERKERGREQKRFDGSGDEEATRKIAQNKPGYYDDCVPNLEDVFLSERKKKFRTWSGKDFDVHSSGGESSRRGCTLRRSTDDYVHEIQASERAEKEKVLLAAELAWGKKKGSD